MFVSKKSLFKKEKSRNCQNKTKLLEERKQTNDAEILLPDTHRKTSQEHDHLRTIANFTDETGKYLFKYCLRVFYFQYLFLYIALLIAVLEFKK